jgi:hypothetical protein
MTELLEVLAEIEAAGAAVQLAGGKIRIRYREEPQREHLADQVNFLRAHRDDVVEWLKVRTTIPAMPPGVRLLKWSLKETPVAIEACAIVTDSALFARTTLEQLAIALAEPKRWVGWTVPQLIDRLYQIGVDVDLAPCGKPGDSK